MHWRLNRREPPFMSHRTTPLVFVAALAIGHGFASRAARAELPPLQDAGLFCSVSAQCVCGWVCQYGTCRASPIPGVSINCFADDDCSPRCTGMTCNGGRCERSSASDATVDGTVDATLDRQPPDIVAVPDRVSDPPSPDVSPPPDRGPPPPPPLPDVISQPPRPEDVVVSPPADAGTSASADGSVSEDEGVRGHLRMGGCQCSAASPSRSGAASGLLLVALLGLGRARTRARGGMRKPVAR